MHWNDSAYFYYTDILYRDLSRHKTKYPLQYHVTQSSALQYIAIQCAVNNRQSLLKDEPIYFDLLYCSALTCSQIIIKTLLSNRMQMMKGP